MDKVNHIHAHDAQLLRNKAADRLLFGPYRTPEVFLGDELLCEIRGLQVVAGWFGPMQWPKAKARGRPQLIVCGDLLKALKHEMAEVVSLHWGIHTSTVAKWRKRIGLHQQRTSANVAFRSAKMRVSKISDPGTFVIPGTNYLRNRSLLDRRLVSQEAAGKGAWSPHDIEILRASGNQAASKLLGRSIYSVVTARQRYGLKHPSQRYTCRKCGYEWSSFLCTIPRYCANKRCGCRSPTS